MKIAVADNNGGKFSMMIMDHWRDKGHEVKWEPGANPALMDWADLYYVDVWDSNIHCLLNYCRDNNYTPKCKFAVRPIDWDIWVRGVRCQWMVDMIDYFICISPFLWRWLLAEKDDATGQPIQWGDKLHMIQPGLDLDKFPLKTSETDGFQVGMVTGNMWELKGPIASSFIFADLALKDPRWKLHIRGQLSETQYHKLMYPHFIKSRGLKDRVTIHGNYDDMNRFYEQVDLLLVPSLKEGFSYATAEAMSKGIPCVINNFMGSEEIWPKECIYNTSSQAIALIERGGCMNYRKYMEDHYSAKKMFNEYDKLLGT